MRKLASFSLVLLLSSSVIAQTRTTTTGSTSSAGFSSGSIFSSTGPTVGSSMNSGTGASTTGSSLGANFNFSQGFTSSGITNPFGTATTGRTGTGMTGMGGMSGMGGMGMMGMGMGGMGMGMGGMGMGMGGMGMNRNQQNMRGGTGTNGQQYQLRPTVKLGFDPALPTTQARSQQIQTTMARIPSAERFAGANVTVEGRKAIVTGTIDKDKVELFKRLLQLEPGIYEVDVSQVNTSSDASKVRPGAEPVIPTETAPN